VANKETQVFFMANKEFAGKINQHNAVPKCTSLFLYKSHILVKIHDASVHDGCWIIHHDYPPPSATSVLVLYWAEWK
jgi:hypothetical protein